MSSFPRVASAELCGDLSLEAGLQDGNVFSEPCASVGDFPCSELSVGSVSIPGCPQAQDEGKAWMLILTGELCWNRQGDEEGTCPGWGFVPAVQARQHSS